MEKARLDAYADLIVKKGLNLDRGQEVLLIADFEQAPFVRDVVEKCYRAGASRVVVDWHDMPLDKLHVTYQDENFQMHDEWVEGYLARVMQHEFDHLDGVVYTDHLKGLRRQLMQNKLKQLLKGNFTANYRVKPFRK